MLQLVASLVLMSPVQMGTVMDFTIGADKRQALVFAPQVRTANPPVVFGFHGHGGTMRNAARTFQMQSEWPEAVVVYMQGLPSTGKITDTAGVKNGWQFEKDAYGGRDLKFFDTVYDSLEKSYHFDRNRVYAMGHSNGGAFTYLLWATKADKFAAFGPSGAVAGVYRGQLIPKPAFVVSGEKDQVVRPIAQQLGIRYLKQLNGADGDIKMGVLKGTKADLGLYIYPGDHTYPREANKLMVDFFKSHPRK